VVELCQGRELFDFLGCHIRACLIGRIREDRDIVRRNHVPTIVVEPCAEKAARTGMKGEWGTGPNMAPRP
jgi:hypothetical protein